MGIGKFPTRIRNQPKVYGATAPQLLRQQTFKRRKKFPFFEADMRRQELAEIVQRSNIILSQTIEQRAQLLVIRLGALCERLVFCLMQERQQRLLLNLKMRLQFNGECPNHALAGFAYPILVTRLRRPFACLSQSKRGVVLAR